jgi:hypothetical protein
VPELRPSFSSPGELPHRLVHRELEHLVDVLPPHGHVEHLGLEPLAAARVARHEDVGHEHHLDLDVARALARLAPPAGDVEREGAPRVAALPRERRAREDAPDLVAGASRT